MITAFSNIFVQSYINYFGSAVMAGWGSYNKLDSFIMLPLQSMAMAATTFVSQNIGAKNPERADKGTRDTILLSLGVTGFIVAALLVFARPAVGLFSQDPEVIDFGVLFMRSNTIFLLFNCVNHVLAGALRGRGDANGPMFMMLASFVVIRQIYLFVITRFVANTPFSVGFGYPVGWMTCFVLELSYFYFRWLRPRKKAGRMA